MTAFSVFSGMGCGSRAISRESKGIRRLATKLDVVRAGAPGLRAGVRVITPTRQTAVRSARMIAKW